MDKNYTAEELNEIKQLRRERATTERRRIEGNDDEPTVINETAEDFVPDAMQPPSAKMARFARGDEAWEFSKFRSDPEAREYSDDEEERVKKEVEEIRREAAEEGRDSWLESVVVGDERSKFKDKEAVDKALEAKKAELQKQEERLSRRADAGLTDAEKLSLLIGMLTSDKQTPADLMRRIKADAQPQQDPKGKRKGGYRKPAKLPPEAQAAMDRVSELCDGLAMSGMQVYTESKSNLQKMQSRVAESGGQYKAQSLRWQFRFATKADDIYGPKSAKEMLDFMTENEDLRKEIQVRQITEEGDAIENLWLPAEGIQWDKVLEDSDRDDSD